MPNDHYVAQTYLRQFAGPGGFLHAYRKSDLTNFPCRPQDICRELGGDLIPDFLANTKALGEYRQIFEPYWNQAVSELRSGHVSRDVKHAISGYLANLLVCTPAMTRTSVESRNHFAVENLRAKYHLNAERGIVDEKLKEGLDALDAGTIVVETDRDFARAHNVANLMDYAWGLYNADWIVVKNLTSVPFFTSDNPVAFDDPGPFVGGQPGLPRYLTISSEVCLYVEMGTKRREDEPDFARAPEGRVRFATIDKEAAVSRINLAIIRCAEDLVVAPGPRKEFGPLVAENAAYRVSNEYITIREPDGFLQGLRFRVWDPAKNVAHVRSPPEGSHASAVGGRSG